MNKTFLGIFTLFICGNLSAQTQISGRILDASNEPIPGINIRVLNSLQGTSAGADGSFVLKNLKGAQIILEYSGIGFVTKTDTLKSNDMPQNIEVVLDSEVYLADALIVESTRASDLTPMTFTNIEQEEIQEKNTGKDIPYILNQSPNMISTSDAGAGVGYTYLRLRGMDQSNINVTINGIALNDPESHLVYYVNIPDFANSLSSIQIQRGVGTSTNGAAAFGGTINMQTQDLEEEPYVDLSQGYGSFNTSRTSVKFGTGVFKKYWALDGKVSLIQSDGYLDRASSNLMSYYFSSGYNNGKSSLKLLLFGGAEETYQAWNGVDSATMDTARTYNSAGEIYADSTWEVLGFYPNEVDHYNQDHAQLHFNHRFSNRWKMHAALHYTYGRGYFEQYKSNVSSSELGLDSFPAGIPSGFTNMVIRPWLKNHYYGLVYNLSYVANSWLLDIGGGANNYEGQHFGDRIWERYSDMTNSLGEFYRNKGEKLDVNEYLKLTKILGEKVHLFADLQYRYIHYQIKGTDDLLGTLDLVRQYHFFNPKAGVTWVTGNHSNLYYSMALANREPNRTDILYSDNFNAQSEKLYDQELGFRWSRNGHGIDANVYYMYYENQLIPTGQINDVGEQIRANSGRSYRAGVELAMVFQLLPNLIYKPNVALSMNENLNHFQVSSDGSVKESRTPISYSPNMVLNGELKFQPFKFLTLTQYARYVGTQYLDNSGNEAALLDPYGVVDLRLEYHTRFKWAEKFSLFVQGFNILNHKYTSNGYMWGTTPYYYPQAGINFMAGVNLRL